MNPTCLWFLGLVFCNLATRGMYLFAQNPYFSLIHPAKGKTSVKYILNPISNIAPVALHDLSRLVKHFHILATLRADEMPVCFGVYVDFHY